MKRYVFILFLLFVSCSSTSQSSQPIKFYAKKDHKYYFRIIIGSDTQTVDKAYEKDYTYLLTHAFLLSDNHTFEDSFLVEGMLRKYYVTKDLEKSINFYMFNNYNEKVSCQETWKYPENNYEFTFNGKKNKPLKFCMNNLEIAKIYFKGLKKVIENSSKDTNQNKEVLFDLNSLINVKAFHFSIHQKQILLRNVKTPNEKKRMQSIIDTLEYYDNLDQQRFQNN